MVRAVPSSHKSALTKENGCELVTKEKLGDMSEEDNSDVVTALDFFIVSQESSRETR